MEVPRYFSVSTVAQMLGGVSEKFIRQELRRGRFFPLVAGVPDASSVVRVAGNDMVSLVGVTWYLRTFCAWPAADAAARFLQNEMSGGPVLSVLDAGTPARTPGELKRRISNG